MSAAKVKAKNLLVSFSGGRTSALLARLVQTSPLFAGYRKIFIYANTGKERQETLDFVHECDTRWGLGVVWVEAVVHPEKGQGTKHRVVNYETAIRNTDPESPDHPFTAVIAKYGLPSNAFPHCTRELKLRPMASYLKSIGVTEYETALGIRADEPSRAGPNPGIIYPLVELRIDEAVRTFWDRQDFDLGLKDYQGNCDLCFKKSLRKRLTILRESPEVAGFWASKEGKRVDPRGRAVDLAFDRTGLRISDLLTLSKDPALELAVDRHDERLADKAKNPQLFEMLCGIDWDSSTDCLCHA
jgi:hypothetical protein